MGMEGLGVILFFVGLFVVLYVREMIMNITGLKDGSKGLMFATIGFFIGVWLLICAGMVVYVKFLEG